MPKCSILFSKEASKPLPFKFFQVQCPTLKLICARSRGANVAAQTTRPKVGTKLQQRRYVVVDLAIEPFQRKIRKRLLLHEKWFRSVVSKVPVLELSTAQFWSKHKVHSPLLFESNQQPVQSQKETFQWLEWISPQLDQIHHRAAGGGYFLQFEPVRGLIESKRRRDWRMNSSARVGMILKRKISSKRCSPTIFRQT